MHARGPSRCCQIFGMTGSIIRTQSLFEVTARLADGEQWLDDALPTITTDKYARTKMSNIVIRVIRVIRKSVLLLFDDLGVYIG